MTTAADPITALAAEAGVPAEAVRDRGETRVVLDREVGLGADPPADARFVAFLRECQSHALPVRWSGRAEGTVPWAALHHLPPPAALAGAAPAPGTAPAPAPGTEMSAGAVPAADALEEWTANHRYGACYFRRGPGFLLVKDGREPSAVSRFTLDHPTLVSVFERCLTPCPATRFSGEESEAADLLASEALLWDAGGVLVTLPTAVRQWPIPFMAV